MIPSREYGTPHGRIDVPPAGGVVDPRGGSSRPKCLEALRIVYDFAHARGDGCDGDLGLGLCRAAGRRRAVAPAPAFYPLRRRSITRTMSNTVSEAATIPPMIGHALGFMFPWASKTFAPK